MKSFGSVAVLVLMSGTAISSAASLAPTTAVSTSSTRLARPNHFGVELGGRGLLYTLQYDRAISEQLSVGAGVGVIPFCVGDCDGGLTIAAPVYANLYFAKNRSTPFLTVGTSVFMGLQANPMVGLGYETRDLQKGGLSARFTAYAISSGGRFYPWAGLTIGGR